MKQPETTIVFAGLDSRTSTTLPAWYAAQHPEAVPMTFADAVRSLPRVIEAPVAYYNDYLQEWVETSRFTALVEPDALADTAVDPLFHVPTDSYSVINPVDVYGPLEQVLRTTPVDEQPLSEVVFGEIRHYRGGGEVHMDIMFDGLSVTLPGRCEPITMGVTSGYDFFGGHAVYVEGFARDTVCANSIRQLTAREAVKHVGEIDAFDAWWEHILGQLGLVADDLCGFILDAQELVVDFRDLPFDVQAFYELLGLPEYLATRAAADARATSNVLFELDLWTLHSGATHALTHFFSGKEGAALDRYVRLANDLLFNPSEVIGHVVRAYEAQDVDGDGSQDSGRAQLERVETGLQARVEQFERREQTLRQRFETLDS